MTREDAHKLIDQLFDAENPTSEGEVVESTETAKPERTDGKRAIRTKSTGDRVYLLDDNSKTKSWITSPEILAKLGFGMDDVQDLEDSELLDYQMSASIYKIDE